MTAWDEHFKNRRWRVLAEADGRVTCGTFGAPGALGENPVCAVFKKGHFEFEGDGVFQSPLSFNKGRRGVLLQEVADGADVPGSVIPVGEKALPRIKAAGALVG